MADTILELGLARDAEGLEAALWEVDVRVIQQLAHARGVRMGRRVRWSNACGSDGALEKRFKRLSEREFTWPSGQR